MSKLAIKALVATVAAIGLGAAAAQAGECPADKVIAASMTAAGHTANKGVTDTVLATNNLGDYFPELASRVQRIRYLTIEAGGAVAWHAHEDRPALIYVVEGSITEYRSTCAMPIEHKTGDVAAEIGHLEHWWKNNSGKPVVLISTDMPRVAETPKVM